MGIDRQIDGLLGSILAASGKVRVAYLFGSVAEGRAQFESDLDLALETRPTLRVDERRALIARLGQVFGRPVDLIDLDRADGILLGEILDRGRRIHGSDADHVRLALRRIYDEADFQPIRRRALEEQRRAWLSEAE